MKYEFSVFPGQDVIVFGDPQKPRDSISKARDLTKENRVIFISDFDQSIVDFLGNADYILTNKIEKPKTVARPRSKVKDFILYNNGFASYNGLTIEDMPEKIYCIPILRYKPIQDGHKIAFSTLQTTLNNAYSLGILSKDEKIYGILNSNMKKYPENRLINVLSFMSQELDKKLQEQTKRVKEFKTISWQISNWLGVSCHKYIYDLFVEKKLEINCSSKLYQILNQVNDLNEKKNSFIKEDNFNLINSLVKIKIEPNQAIEKLETYYPLLMFFDSHIHYQGWRYKTTDQEIRAIQEYINKLGI